MVKSDRKGLILTKPNQNRQEAEKRGRETTNKDPHNSGHQTLTEISPSLTCDFDEEAAGLCPLPGLDLGDWRHLAGVDACVAVQSSVQVHSVQKQKHQLRHGIDEYTMSIRMYTILPMKRREGWRDELQ